MKVAIYIRVSSPKKAKGNERDVDKFLQNPQVQADPLVKMAGARGWEIFKIYSDRMTGSKTEGREGLKELWKDAKSGEFQIVLIWRFDRFARSVRDLLNSLYALQELSIDFVSYKDPVDTTTASGKLMFHVMAAFAEFERDLLLERTMAGLEYAREHGTKSGNAIGRPVKIWNREKAREMIAGGKSIRQVARELGIGKDSIRLAVQGNG